MIKTQVNNIDKKLVMDIDDAVKEFLIKQGIHFNYTNNMFLEFAAEKNDVYIKIPLDFDDEHYCYLAGVLEKDEELSEEGGTNVYYLTLEIEDIFLESSFITEENNPIVFQLLEIFGIPEKMKYELVRIERFYKGAYVVYYREYYNILTKHDADYYTERMLQEAEAEQTCE